MLFAENTYSHIYALDAAIMNALVSGPSYNTTRTVHNHTSERLYDVQNGAYSYYARNDIFTFFKKMYVLDSYGVTLDSVKYPLISTNTLFDMRRTYGFVMVDSEVTYTKDAEYWGVKPFKFDRYFKAYSR